MTRRHDTAAKKAKHREYMRQWREKHPDWYKNKYQEQYRERILAQKLKVRLARPEQAQWQNYKSNAKKRGYDFRLTKEEFLEYYYGSCHYCGLTPARGIDRYDNDDHYHPANCEPCCGDCNQMKGTRSYEKFKFLVHRIAQQHPL